MQKVDDLIPFYAVLVVNPGGVATIFPAFSGVKGYLISAQYRAVTATTSALGDVTVVVQNDNLDPMSNAPSVDGQTSVALAALPNVLTSDGFSVKVTSTNADATAGLGLHISGIFRRVH